MAFCSRFHYRRRNFATHLGARAHLQFLINPTDISMDRLVTDAHFLGDLFVEKALAQMIQDLLLARERISPGCWAGAVRWKGLHDLAGDVRGHGGAAAMHLADGVQQLGPRSAPSR